MPTTPKALRATLMKLHADLGAVGVQVDTLLRAAEDEHLAHPSDDEQVVQTLGALSREIRAARSATGKAVAAVDQLQRVEGQ